MSKKFLFKLLIVIVVIIGCFYFAQKFLSTTNVIKNLAGVIEAPDTPVSITDIKADYASSTEPIQEKTKILIIPGHEPNYGGAQFGNIYERNLVVEIGQDLKKFLENNNNYQVSITRDTQAWNPVFSDYFKNNWNNIINWEKTSRQDAYKLTPVGDPSAPVVKHNTAPTNVAIRLYGITKWANENGIDLMIHIHLNDYPGHSPTAPGKYSGLVIYTPAQKYANSSTTKAIASSVFNRLSLYNPIDNLKIESAGMIDDPTLIAVGSNNTANSASMLIEYNYIYEPQFVNPNVRSLALNDLAYQTYLGLQDFFKTRTNIVTTSAYNPVIIYNWQTPVIGNSSDSKDIYALQTALIMDGDFPPIGKSKNDCPHSGFFGTCTNMAINEFQKKNDISDEGVAGAKTFSLLNKIYTENSVH